MILGRWPSVLLFLAAAGLAVAGAAPHASARPRRPAARRQAGPDLAKLRADLESGDRGRILSALDAIAAWPNLARETAPLVNALLLRGASADACQRAIEVAGALAQPSSSLAIAPYVRHRIAALRRAAARALVRTGGPAAVQALRRALSSPDPTVRSLAAGELGALGALEALPDLFHALDHRVEEAAVSIGELCRPNECDRFEGYLGKVSFTAMTRGFDKIVFRAEADMPDAAKIRVVGRVRALGTPAAAHYLASVRSRWPRSWSPRVRRALDQAVHALGGGS
jgi:HEAT repeats